MARTRSGKSTAGGPTTTGAGSAERGAASTSGRRGAPRPFDPRRSERSDSADAFLPDPGDGPAHSDDDLAESLGEGFVEAATTANDTDHGKLDEEVVPEEIGGPFLESDEVQEFATGVDESNPPDAEPEPLPRAVAGLVEGSPEEELAAASEDEAGGAMDDEQDERQQQEAQQRAAPDEAPDQSQGEGSGRRGGTRRRP